MTEKKQKKGLLRIYRERYKNAAHAVQSGVKYEQEFFESDCGSPKNLRTGVNVAMRDLGSLVGLLIRRGFITEIEYVSAIADGMEEEKESYEAMLSRKMGKKVTLT